MEIIAGLVGALCGGIVTLIVTRIEARRADRVKATHDLYRQWQSGEMQRARIVAQSLLHEAASAPAPPGYHELNEALWSAGRRDDWIAIDQVLHFFESCGELLENDAIDRRLTGALMGRYVEYWFDRYIDSLWSRSQHDGGMSGLGWHGKIRGLRQAV